MASSSVELLTNSLVSSILDEVTGRSLSQKPPAAAPTSSSTASPLLKTSLIASLGAVERTGKMRVSPSVATSGAGKDPNHATKKRDGKVSGRKLVEKMFLKSAFAQFSSLKVLSRLAVSQPVQAVMAAGEDGGLLMTSFVTQLLTFCAEALKESTAIHDPINHMFVELPEIERTMAVLHSKFAQNYYSAAGDCVPRATVSDTSRHATRKSGSPTRKTGATAIYERAGVPQPTPRSSFLR